MQERIRMVRKNAGLTQAEFGERIGVKANTITSYETGLRVPSDAVIVSICREFDVSESWLRTGEGEMMEKTDPDVDLAKMVGKIVSSDDDLIKLIIKSYFQLDEKDKAAIRKLVDHLVDETRKKNTPGE